MSDQRLPAGLTCGDCVSRHRCQETFGRAFSLMGTACLWKPVMFQQGLQSSVTRGVRTAATSPTGEAIQATADSTKPPPTKAESKPRSLFD